MQSEHISIAGEVEAQSLWRQSDFLKLWVGQTVSELGSTVTREGIPLLAVLTLNASTVQMGILSALGSIPIVLFALFAGVWVDRVRRRPLMIAADVGRIAILLTIPLAAVFGVLRIELLYVVIALVGVLTVFFNVAYEAYIPALVHRSRVLEANSKMAMSGSLAEMAGPELAGILVQLLSAPVAILVDALSFVASVISLALIRKPEAVVVPLGERQPVGRELAEGLRYVQGSPLLRALAISIATLSFFGNFFGPLYTLFAIRDLGMTPIALGFTIAMGGVGSLAGSLLAVPVVRRFGLGRTLVGSLGFGIVTTMLIPLARGPLPLALAMLVAAQLLGDCLRTIFFVNVISLRQSITPDRLLGRTSAGMELLAAGLGPLGALIGGALAATIGVRATLFVAPLGAVLACLTLLLSPVRTLQGFEQK